MFSICQTLCLGLSIDIIDSLTIPLKPPFLNLGISFPPSLLLESRKSYFCKVELDPQFFPLVFHSEKRLLSPQAFMLESRKVLLNINHLLFLAYLIITTCNKITSNRFTCFPTHALIYMFLSP